MSEGNQNIYRIKLYSFCTISTKHCSFLFDYLPLTRWRPLFSSTIGPDQNRTPCAPSNNIHTDFAQFANFHCSVVFGFLSFTRLRPLSTVLHYSADHAVLNVLLIFVSPTFSAKFPPAPYHPPFLLFTSPFPPDRSHHTCTQACTASFLHSLFCNT